jgi:hypothetical protein
MIFNSADQMGGSALPMERANEDLDTPGWAINRVDMHHRVHPLLISKAASLIHGAAKIMKRGPDGDQ